VTSLAPFEPGADRDIVSKVEAALWTIEPHSESRSVCGTLEWNTPSPLTPSKPRQRNHITRSYGHKEDQSQFWRTRPGGSRVNLQAIASNFDRIRAVWQSGAHDSAVALDPQAIAVVLDLDTWHQARRAADEKPGSEAGLNR